jgi:N-terminal acetyltransferase 2
MVRRLLPRFSVFRSLAPRLNNPPLLPLTSRIRISPPPALSLTHSPSSRPLFSHFHARRASSPPTPSSPSYESSLPPNPSFSQRLKYLMKKYGWYTLGVYFLLSVADFAVAFAGINLLGAEHVSRVAASVKQTVAGLIHSRPPDPGRQEVENSVAHGGQEGLYAMIVLAYTIHKTLFLPVRVGLTAALTPKMVGWLGKRGWAGGEGTKRAATEIRERMRRGRNRD